MSVRDHTVVRVEVPLCWMVSAFYSMQTYIWVQDYYVIKEVLDLI